MIRSSLTVKCSQSLSMLRSMMLRSIKLLGSLWCLWSFNCMFRADRAWGTYGGQVANSNPHCSAISSFEGEQLSLDLQQPSCVSTNYSLESLLSGSCPSVLLKPISMVSNAKTLVHTVISVSLVITIFLFDLMKRPRQTVVWWMRVDIPMPLSSW